MVRAVARLPLPLPPPPPPPVEPVDAGEDSLRSKLPPMITSTEGLRGLLLLTGVVTAAAPCRRRPPGVLSLPVVAGLGVLELNGDEGPAVAVAVTAASESLLLRRARPPVATSSPLLLFL